MKLIPIDAVEVSGERPLVPRARTQAAMVRWFKAMQAAGIPQVWVHYPDGTKLEFRTTLHEEVEVDTWADVA